MRWWREQDAEIQAATKALLASGQIEFANGGWCMADDSSPSMDAELDQLTLGHRYIQDTVNVFPKNAWHIDPFGMSASYSTWFESMNYTSWVMNRIDTRLKDLWRNETMLQFLWRPKNSGANGLFTHVLDTHYGSPDIVYKGNYFHFDFEYFGGLGGGSNPGGQVFMLHR